MSFLTTYTIKPTLAVCQPTLTGNPSQDILILQSYDKHTLLSMCENNPYVFNLCNQTMSLLQTITAPS